MTIYILPRVKWTIRSFSMQQARGLADKALKIDNEARYPPAVESCLEGRPERARSRELTFKKRKRLYTQPSTRYQGLQR
jgi:hypothetical protein